MLRTAPVEIINPDRNAPAKILVSPGERTEIHSANRNVKVKTASATYSTVVSILSPPRILSVESLADLLLNLWQT